MADKINRICTVYGLASSRDAKIRYVGQTFDKISRRRTGHLHKARGNRQTPVCNWIRDEIDAGYAIDIRVLETNARHNISEIRWISKLRKAGFQLVNATNGGAGFCGYKMTETHRLAISAALSGKKKTAEHNAKVAAALAGRKPSQQTINGARKAAQRGWSEARKSACYDVPKEVRSERARRGRLSLSPKMRSKISSEAAKSQWDKRRAMGTDRGVHVNNAKLDDYAVREIRRAVANGATHVSVATQYGVSRKAVSKIWHRQTWAHIQ